MELRYCEKCGDVIRVDTDVPLGPEDHFICQGCRDGKKEGPRAPTAAGPDIAGLFERESLNLFSPDTVAIRKQQMQAEVGTVKKGDSARLKLVRTGSQSVAPKPPSVDSDAPSPKKILFRCLHCRSTLSIRPVEQTSKLTCPNCAKSLYVTPAGKLLVSPPSSVLARPGAARGSESARVSKGGGSGSSRPPSVRVGPAGTPVQAAAGSTAGTTPARSVRLVRPPSVAVAGAAPVASASPAPSARVASAPGAAGESRAPSAARGPSAAAATAPASSRSARSLAPVPKAPGAAASPSSRAVRPRAAAEAAPGAAPSAARKAQSAFDEHRANEDPFKTAFLTEQATHDLADMATDPLLDALPKVSLLADGILEESDVVDPDEILPVPMQLTAAAPAPPAPAVAGVPASSPGPAESSAASRPAKVSFFRAFFGGLFLVAVLYGPVVLVEGLTPRAANAEVRTGGPAEATVHALETVGARCLRGLRRMLGSER